MKYLITLITIIIVGCGDSSSPVGPVAIQVESSSSSVVSSSSSTNPEVAKIDSIQVSDGDTLVFDIPLTDTVINIRIHIEYSNLNPTYHVWANGHLYTDMDGDDNCVGAGNGEEYTDTELESCICDPSIDQFQCENINYVTNQAIPKIYIGSTDDNYTKKIMSHNLYVYKGDSINTVQTHDIGWYNKLNDTGIPLFNQLIMTDIGSDYGVRLSVEIEYINDTTEIIQWGDMSRWVIHKDY